MKCKIKTKRFLTAIPALTILAFLVTNVYAHTITVPTNCYFGIPAYGTYINFNTQTSLHTAYRENNIWYFDTDGFKVQNANMTITNLFSNNQLKFTLVNITLGTSTTTIYTPNRGKPVSVSGATSWNYNIATETITLTVQHSSPVIITIDWTVPTPLVQILRSNYYAVMILISIAPIALVAGLLVGLVKGKESLDLKAIFGVITLSALIIIGYIILIIIMNALLG